MQSDTARDILHLALVRPLAAALRPVAPGAICADLHLALEFLQLHNVSPQRQPGSTRLPRGHVWRIRHVQVRQGSLNRLLSPATISARSAPSLPPSVACRGQQIRVAGTL